jgi:uncharacterized protein YjiS (DUF1127 family)
VKAQIIRTLQLEAFQETIMATTRTNIQPLPTNTAFLPRGLGVYLGRLANRWIAGLLARLEREAVLAALRDLGDRDLKDIGIHRGQIGDTLTEIARERARLQRCRQA